MKKLLLHTCCGPCLLSAQLALREKYHIIPFWYNPNIHPYREFKRRLNAFKEVVGENESIIDNTYDLKLYFNAVEWGDNRCEGCYRLRLSRSADIAREVGIDLFTTTLLISPYQDISLICDTGREEGIRAGVGFLCQDMREHYEEGHQKAREMGLYMQGYCGCVFSEEERYRKKK